VSTLESHLIQVLEIDADDRFDGISAIAYESRKKQVIGAAVVTNRGVFKGRQRFNLAHELGHIILDVTPNIDEEQCCPSVWRSLSCSSRRPFVEKSGLKDPTFMRRNYVSSKQRYGMSLQAFIRRLLDLDIITKSHFKQWMIDISRLGWRKVEPGGVLS
jgi:Zn-dependent peptidase ImmA (M78 family)